jgi:hypothetical protein
VDEFYPYWLSQNQKYPSGKCYNKPMTILSPGTHPKIRSKATEKAIADLRKFLEPRHPSSVLQFITGVMVAWAHFDKRNPPSQAEVDRLWGRYLTLLRSRLDVSLSLISSFPHLKAKEDRKVLPIPPMVFEEKKEKEIVALLGRMLPEDALDFMVEITTNWCFSIPINFLSLIPDGPVDESDKAIADAIYTWLVRYSDLWC